MEKSRLPLIATLAYALVGCGWILAGNALSDLLYSGNSASSFELYKGLAYVAITAAVLHFFLHQIKKTAPSAITFGEIAAEFRNTVHSSERTLRWLPAGLVIILLTLVVALAAGLAWVRGTMLDAGETSTEAQRYNVAQQIGRSIQVVDLALADIAHDYATGRLPSPSTELRSYKDRIGPLVRELWIIDGKGRLIHGSEPETAAVDRSGSDHFLHHRDSAERGFYVGKPRRDAATGIWSIGASRAIRTASGEFLGMAEARLDPLGFPALWRSPTLANGGSVALFRDDGVLLMRNPYIDDVIGKSYRDAYAWQELVPRHPSATYRYSSIIDSIDRIYAFGRIPDYDNLIVFVGVPTASLLRDWRILAGISTGGLLVFIAAITLLATVLLRQFAQRIAAQKMASELARYPLQSLNPVLTMTPDGSHSFMNPAARTLFDGISGTAALQTLESDLASLALEPSPGTRELSVGTRIFAVSYNPQAAAGCDFYLTDVTAQKSDEALIRLFYDLPFIGMAILQPDLRGWHSHNDAFSRLLGHSGATLAQRELTDLVHPDHRAAVSGLLEEIREDRSDGDSRDLLMIRGDGSEMHAAVSIRAIRRADHSIDCVVVTLQDITSRAKQVTSLRQQRDLYAALSACNEAIVRVPGRQALFDSICRIAVEKAGFTFAWIGIADPAACTVDLAARHGNDAGYLDKLRISLDPAVAEGRGPTSLVIREGSHQIVNDIAHARHMAPWKDAAARAGIRASAAFPVRQSGRVVASLNVYTGERGYFDRDMVRLLDEIVDDLSYALDKITLENERESIIARLQEAESRWQFALEGGEHGVWEWNARTGKVYFSHRWKSMLGYTDEDIGDTLDEWKSRVHPDDLPATLELLDRHLRGETAIYTSEHRLRRKDGGYRWILDHGKVMTRDAEGRPLTVIGTHTDISEIRAAELRHRESESKFRGIVEQSLVGIYIIDDATMYYANPRTAEIFGYAPDDILGPKIQRLVHPDDWPLVLDNIRKRLKGEVRSISYEFRGRRSDGSDVNIGAHGSRGEYAGRTVIIGVLQDITQRLQNEKRLDEYVARLEQSIRATTNAISEMVELRDPYTAGHERRVAEIAMAIGAELGLPDHDIAGLGVMGHVHDVGKITVPAEILSKPGRLSAAEYEIVKAHAEKGYDILKDIDFPWPVAQAVCQHHERMDGSGYPRGLKGEDILLSARILAVADVVESMASHRPYRPALGLDAALAEIEKNAGRLYDAAVASACLRLFREKHHHLPP